MFKALRIKNFNSKNSTLKVSNGAILLAAIIITLRNSISEISLDAIKYCPIKTNIPRPEPIEVILIKAKGIKVTSNFKLSLRKSSKLFFKF